MTDRYRYSTGLFKYGQNGEANPGIDELVNFIGYDGDLWVRNNLFVIVSFESERAPTTSLSVDFVDPAEPVTGLPEVRKRVFRDDSGTTTDFVSDSLGLGWMVPPRVNGGGPMSLRFQAQSTEDIGAAFLLVERWWECKLGKGCCP